MNASLMNQKYGGRLYRDHYKRPINDILLHTLTPEYIIYYHETDFATPSLRPIAFTLHSNLSIRKTLLQISKLTAFFEHHPLNFSAKITQIVYHFNQSKKLEEQRFLISTVKHLPQVKDEARKVQQFLLNKRPSTDSHSLTHAHQSSSLCHLDNKNLKIDRLDSTLKLSRDSVLIQASLKLQFDKATQTYNPLSMSSIITSHQASRKSNALANHRPHLIPKSHNFKLANQANTTSKVKHTTTTASSSSGLLPKDRLVTVKKLKNTQTSIPEYKKSPVKQPYINQSYSMQHVHITEALSLESNIPMFF